MTYEPAEAVSTEPDDLREAVAKLYWAWNGRDPNWDATLPRPTEEQVAQDFARELLTLLRQHGVVRLAENQELPEPTNTRFRASIAYMVGQRDMLKAGFRRVREL